MTRTLTLFLFLVWAGLSVYGIVAFLQTEPTGDSFTRGMNRVVTLFQWEGAALFVAVVAWFTKGKTGGLLGKLPLMVTGGALLVLILLYVGLVTIGRSFGI